MPATSSQAAAAHHSPQQWLPPRTGAEVERLLHGRQDLLVIHAGLSAAIGVHVDGQGLGHADGIRHLHQAALGQAARHNGLGSLAGDVGAGAVHLGGVLAGEGAATVGAPAAIGVDDDLAAGEASVTVGAADHKAA